MSKPIDHVAYLSQEIGPRPSGTEEEQQAALYITNHLQKDAHLSASIEDFNCTTNPDLPKVICNIVSVLMLVLSIVVPDASVPAAVLSALAAVILILEALDKPVVSQFLPKGISQNVVSKYEPVRNPDDTTRRRKVIVVANYDSGKVRHDLARPLLGIRNAMGIIFLVVSVIVPIFLLVWGIVFIDAEGDVALFGKIFELVLAIIMLIPVIVFVINKLSAYNEAANCNASGVAVMLEVARRLGTGEAAETSIPANSVMHDEQTAYDAGVVPDGATIHYDDASFKNKDTANDTLATTREKSSSRVSDIADNLVNVKDEPIPVPDEESLSKSRQDTRAALSTAPAGTLAEAAAKAESLKKQAEQRAAEEAAAQEAAREQAAKEAEEKAAAEAARQEEEERRRAEAAKPAGVPDWYKKATEKAHQKTETALALDKASKFRSRYAGFPEKASEDDASTEDKQEKATNVADTVSSEDEAVVHETASESYATDSTTVTQDEIPGVITIEGDAPRATSDLPFESSEAQGFESGTELRGAAEQQPTEAPRVIAQQQTTEAAQVAAMQSAPASNPVQDASSQIDAKSSQVGASNQPVQYASQPVQTSQPAETYQGAAQQAQRNQDIAQPAQQPSSRQHNQNATQQVQSNQATAQAQAEPVNQSHQPAHLDQSQQSLQSLQTGELYQSGNTTAMPPLTSAGNLDLDALRAAAKQSTASDTPETQGSNTETASASTTRLPQMMYYTPPADRSDIMRDRSQKDRVTVSAEGIQQAAVMDAAENVQEESRYDKYGAQLQSEDTASNDDASAQQTSSASQNEAAYNIPPAQQTSDVSEYDGIDSVASAALAPNTAHSATSAQQTSTTPYSAETASAYEDAPSSTGDQDASSQPGAHALHAAQPNTAQSAQGVQTNASEQRVITPNIPVVDLPEISLPSMNKKEPESVRFEDFRQRAPLASAAESKNKEAAKSLLATTLPTIETNGSDPDATVGMPISPEKSQNVSLTGSFAAVEAIGSQPVGDELIAGIDADDIYVDDADDSDFDSEFTETGAFAGPGYVDMPESRVSAFFGKFHRKNKKKKKKEAKDEESAQEWLGVDEDFDARSAGKARGSWSSFRDENEDWEGGAFRARGDSEAVGSDDEGGYAEDALSELESEEASSRGFIDSGADVSADEFAAVAAMAADKASEAGYTYDDSNEVQQIYSFASGDIDTEVWFVALGSELANHGGIRAFLADHANDMRGALIVNLEGVGTGQLSYLEHEGALKQAACSPRMKRFLRKASQVSGIELQSVNVNWRESPASFAMKHHAQAVTIAGMDGKKPALYCEADDVIENIDEHTLNRAADYVVDFLRSV